MSKSLKEDILHAVADGQAVTLPDSRIEKAPFRPCKADGKPAHFHRWVEEDKALLRLKFYVSDDAMELINKKFHSEGLAPINSEITKISTTFALVEYADGTVGKVEPEKIKFTDREGEQ